MPGTGFFERQFRAQFTPEGGGYLFRHKAADYQFDAEEVAQFVAEWRLYWANPLLWAGYALVGIAIPLWAYSHHLPELAVIVAVVAAIAMVTTLHFPWRQPREVALGRAPIEEQRAEPTPTAKGLTISLVLWAGLCAFWLTDPTSGRPSSQMLPLFWMVVLALRTGFYAWRLVDFKRGGSGKAPVPVARAFDMFSPLAAAFVTAVVLWAAPGTNSSDRWFLMGLFAILAAVTIYQWLNPPEEDA